MQPKFGHSLQDPLLSLTSCSSPPLGELLLPPKDPVAFLLRRPGGRLHSALHQPVWEQPPGAVLRGVSCPVAPDRAGSFHPVGDLRRPLGGAVYQG